MYLLNSRKLLARITKKWPVKVLSIAAAIILMLFHRMSTLDTRVFYSSLREEISGELMPSGSYSRVVKVSIRGEANSINPILEEDIEIFIDLKKYTTEGTYQVPVQVRKKGSALGAGLLEISVDPLEIPLRLERRVSRNILLNPVFRGNVAAGFEIAGQTMSPAGIVAVGPRSVMDSITNFQTDIIDLEGRNEDFTVRVNIINQNPFIVISGNGTAEFHGSVRRSVRASENRQWQQIQEPLIPEQDSDD